ncbi:hypothetical protein RJT34_33208 [Clitoria ternatea]|uniref:Uncharacterized protein n=1 Tax=Clitoria ternatea TaxID=43366 RepID=A0AAN9EXU6_CLITE
MATISDNVSVVAERGQLAMAEVSKAETMLATALCRRHCSDGDPVVADLSSTKVLETGSLYIDQCDPSHRNLRDARVPTFSEHLSLLQ